MRVLLVGNYAADQQHSMRGFADALLTGLTDRGVDVRLVAPKQVFGRFGQPHAGFGKWLGYADKFGLFPHDLRRLLSWADIVHVCDQGNALYSRYLAGIPHLVTCHDMMAIRSALGEIPGWQTSRTGRVYQQFILNGLDRACHVSCVTEATRQDLLRISHIPAARVAVVYNGLYSSYRPMANSDAAATLQSLGVDARTPYLLHIGGNQPYKNRLGVLQIFAALRKIGGHEGIKLKLVMAGKPFTPEMKKFVIENNQERHVMELTKLTNEQLRVLYSAAKALVFPSFYEGFGLPIIEAQACGCPVFTSDRAPMTEVGGDAAIYFNPTQPEHAANVIAENLASLSGLVDVGLKNVLRFSPEKMIDEYMALYRRLIGPGGRVAAL